MSRNIPEEYVLVSTLFVKGTEATQEEFFDFLYDNKKVKGWFNFFPFIWFHTNSEKFDEGKITSFCISLIPFCYDIICKKILPNKRGFDVTIGGLMRGHGRFELISRDGGTFLHHELDLKGKTPFIHKYYNLVSKGHNGYMRWRLNVLKKHLIKHHLESVGK